MVFDEETVYSFGRKPQYYRWTTPMEYMLYASPKEAQVEQLRAKRRGQSGQAQKRRAGLADAPPASVVAQWKQDVPMLVRAMVMAHETLFLAGPPDVIDEPKTLKTIQTPETQQLLARQAAALDGSEGAILWAVAKADGQKLAEHKLDALPVFDGMIAAGDRIYCATTDGDILALGE